MESVVGWKLRGCQLKRKSFSTAGEKVWVSLNSRLWARRTVLLALGSAAGSS
jgi:hypothetical protein